MQPPDKSIKHLRRFLLNINHIIELLSNGGIIPTISLPLPNLKLHCNHFHSLLRMKSFSLSLSTIVIPFRPSLIVTSAAQTMPPPRCRIIGKLLLCDTSCIGNKAVLLPLLFCWCTLLLLQNRNKKKKKDRNKSQIYSSVFKVGKPKER